MTIKKLKLNSEIIVLILILSASLALRIFLSKDLSYPDSFYYSQLANNFNQHYFFQPDWYYNFRFLFIIPLAIILKIFGIHSYAVLILPLGCYILEFLLLIKIAKMLLPKINTIIPAILIALYPIDVKASINLLPDITLSLILAFSFYLFLLGIKRGVKIYFLFAGITTALGMFVQEHSLIFNIVLVLYLLSINNFKKLRKYHYSIGYLLAGNIIIIFLELMISYIKTGNMFYIFSNYLRFSSIQLNLIDNKIIRNPIQDMLLYPKIMFASISTIFYFYFLIIGLILAFIKKEKFILSLFYWFIVFFLYLEFGFLKLHPYYTLFKCERYLTIFTIPVIIISTYLVGYFVKYLKFKINLKTTIYIFFIISLVLTLICKYYYRDKNTLPDQYVVKFLRDLPDHPVVLIHEQMKLSYEFYWQYNKKFEIYNKNINLNKPYYLVLDSSYFKGLYNENLWKIQNPPEELINIPSSWIKLKEFNNQVTVYQVQ